MPVRLFSWRSLIRPASSTVWPLATAIELFTLRCDTVGVRRAGAAGRDVADLLLDVEQHIAVGVDARHDAQDDAGVAIVDRVDDRRAGAAEHGRAAGRDRHLVADLQGRDLIVEHDDRRRRQHLHVGDAVQRVEDEARLGLRAEQEIEARQRAAEDRAGAGAAQHGRALVGRARRRRWLFRKNCTP